MGHPVEPPLPACPNLRVTELTRGYPDGRTPRNTTPATSPGSTTSTGGDTSTPTRSGKTCGTTAPAADRLFYQSLIQAAVALYHWGRGNRAGPSRLFASGRDKMAGYRPAHHGLDVDGFWRSRGSHWPTPSPTQPPIVPPPSNRTLAVTARPDHDRRPGGALAAFGGVARLFPLPNLVLFPHVVQGLHIFEPRYRQLMADALAADRLIALVLLKPGWEKDYDGRPAIEAVALPRPDHPPRAAAGRPVQPPAPRPGPGAARRRAAGPEAVPHGPGGSRAGRGPRATCPGCSTSAAGWPTRCSAGSSRTARPTGSCASCSPARRRSGQLCDMLAYALPLRWS